MDSPTRNANLNQINNYLNSDPPMQVSVNVNNSPNRVDPNKSVFEGRRNDYIKTDISPPKMSFESSPPRVQGDNEIKLNFNSSPESHGNFAVNANYNNNGMSPQKDIMFSQAATLGSRPQQSHLNQKNYF